MAELKTKKTDASVKEFLARIPDPDRRRDCKTIADIMKKVTKSEPKMWGPSIVGFGSRLYKYASGREIEWLLIGFSPRKQNLTLYCMGAIIKYPQLMKKLGKHKTGKGCLYINKLEDVNTKVLTELLTRAVADLLST